MDLQPSNSDITRIRLFTALASLLLSLQAVYFDDIINRDGIMYLQMVEAYLMGGLEATRLIFDWPALAILIAWFHLLSGMTIENSAFFLNGLFFILLTDTIVRINSLLLKTPQQLIIAAVLVLGFIAINEYRDFIMRDFGYWAFTSLALYQFMRYTNSLQKQYAFLWQIYILIAALFRIEGVVILLTLPLFCFYQQPFKEGLHQFLNVISIFLLSLIVGLLFLLKYDHFFSAFGKLASLSHYLDIAYYLDQLKTNSNILSDNILNKYSEGYATLILISGLLVMMFVKLAKSFSISYLLIYALSFKHSLHQLPSNTRRYHHLLYYFLLINILVLTVFLLWQYFLSSRYMGMALITLLLLSSYTMSSGIERLWQRKNVIVLGFISLALFYNFADAVIQSASKTYIKNTALWAAHHLPSTSKVMTDDEFIMYYFERDNVGSILCVNPIYEPTAFTKEYAAKATFISNDCSAHSDNELQYYDYIIVVEKRRYINYKQYINTLDLELIYRENSKKNDYASVYRIIK